MTITRDQKIAYLQIAIDALKHHYPDSDLAQIIIISGLKEIKADYRESTATAIKAPIDPEEKGSFEYAESACSNFLESYHEETELQKAWDAHIAKHGEPSYETLSLLFAAMQWAIGHQMDHDLLKEEK